MLRLIAVVFFFWLLVSAALALQFASESLSPALYKSAVGTVFGSIAAIYLLFRTAPKRPPDEQLAAEPSQAELWEMRSGRATRAKGIPAWALILRSPYAEGPKSTSWLGGLPVAPKDFVWPREADGSPMPFIAQIDLSKLTPEPTTGQRPPGLPSEGALLAFFGQTCAIRIIGPAELAAAEDIEPPEDLADLQNYDFYNLGRSFRKWQVDPVPYLDDEAERGVGLPNKLADPLRWITTWGMAALEARSTLTSLTHDIETGKRLKEYMAKRGGRFVIPKHKIDESEHHARMAVAAPDVLSSLSRFIDEAEAHEPTSPVDPQALAEIFRQRRALAEVSGNYMVKFSLLGRPKALLQQVSTSGGRLVQDQKFDEVDPGLRPFIDILIGDFRGHALMGLGTIPTSIDPDLRGKDCLLNITGDVLIGTESDHADGFSIWCDRAAMAAGDFSGAVFVNHINV